MKKSVICLVFLLIADTLLAGQKDFAFYAPLNGVGYDEFVRISLPQGVIARTRESFDDIRIFNDLGEEVEYAVVSRHKRPLLFTRWQVVESTQQESGQVFILKRTGPAGLIRSLELLVERKPLIKEVEIFSSADGSSWKFLAKDGIMDLSPHLDVYDTAVELPGTMDPYIKVAVKNVLKTADDPLLSLYLKQIGIRNVAKDSGAVSLTGAVSPLVMGDRCESVFDHACFTQPEHYLDDEGNTIIDLGRVGLFVGEVSFQIADPYFMRTVEVLTSSEYDPASYSHAASGNIFKFDAYGITRAALNLEEEKCLNLRIKILNNGRVPLSISQVTLAWVPRDLFFVPKNNREYTLYFGGRDVPPPKYSIAEMVPAQPLKREALNTWHIGNINMNETCKQDRLMMQRFKMFFSIGFVLLIVYIIGFWIIQLRNRLPGSRP